MDSRWESADTVEIDMDSRWESADAVDLEVYCYSEESVALAPSLETRCIPFSIE